MLKLPFGKFKFDKIRLQKPVVVEIGNDWLKIAEANPFSSGGEITKLSLRKISEIKDNMPSAISGLFKELSLNRQSVILCIPRHLVTLRMIDLPSTDPKEISDMVNLQVGKQTPYSKEEIVSAYKIIDSAKEGYSKVILAVAHRNVINERIETLKSAGVNVGRVSISSEGAYNWFNLAYGSGGQAGGPETVALVDIDSNYSDFIAIRDGKFTFTKNIFIGANHFSDRTGSWKSKLTEELKTCVKRYHVEERNTRIEKMFLSGAARDIDGLDIELSNALNMAVEKTDTFKNVRIKENIRAAQSQNMKLASLVPVVGMALKSAALEIDLIPGEQKILKLMENKRKDLTVTGILFLSIVTAMSFLLVVSLYYKNTYLAQLKKRIAEISKESDEIEKMRLSVDLVKRTLDAKNSSLNILHEIYGIIPTEISLSSIDIDENKQVVLKGRGFAMSDVFKFIKKLEESGTFANVKASYTRTKKERADDKETEYAEFEIVCPYEGR